MGMSRAGETVNATMLAAAIGIDRAIKIQIRRVIGGDDTARPLHVDMGLVVGQGLKAAPAIIDNLPLHWLETARGVTGGRTSLAAVNVYCLDGGRKFWQSIAIMRKSTDRHFFAFSYFVHENKYGIKVQIEIKSMVVKPVVDKFAKVTKK